jgi:competence protein ComEC
MSSEAVAPRRIVGTFVARPALPVVLLFILGIALHAHLPIAPLSWIAAIVACAIAGAATLRWCYASSLFIAVSILLCGLTIAQVEGFYYPADHIAAYATDQTRLAQLELQIDHEPRLLADPFSPHPMPPKQVVTAEVKRVKTWNGWVDARGQILVQIAQPHPRLAISQRVRVLGTLERPSPATNPGQFDWAKYYREQRVLASVHVPLAQNIQIISTSAPGPLDLIRSQSRRLLSAGFGAEQSLDHALLRALLLGDNDPELRDVQEQFKRTGTSHHLSVSGMHVAVLSGFVYLICRIVRIRPRAAVIVTMIFAIVYAIAALPAPPIVRSVLLCAFVGIGIASRRSIDKIQLLSLSVLAMLIYHPLDLLNSGFQLSAGTVLGLMVFAKPAMEFFARFSRPPPDPMARQPGIPLRAAAWCENWLCDAFAVGIVAWIISMPLVAFHFEQINVWAIPASIILAPIVFFGLVGGLLKIVLTLLWPSLAPLWATIAAQPIIWIRHVVQWLGLLPLNAYPLPQIPVWVLLAAYAIMLLALVPTRRPKLQLLLRFSPIAAILFTVLFPLHAIRAAIHRDELSLTLLSVGAGQCAVLDSPSGRTVMIDAGSATLSDVLRKCIAPYLRDRGCTSVDTMMLTHSDYDHISAAGSVAGVFDVREVLVGNRFREHAQSSPPAEALLRTFDALDVPPRVVLPGERIPLGRGAEVEVLWPPARGLQLSSNDSAIVARIHFGGRTILITGDIQEQAERELLKHPDLLKSDVLIAPHHGSSESTTAMFVKAVDPAIVLCSNDRTLTGKQRRFEPMVAGRSLYRTHKCGAITLRIGANGDMEVETFLPQRHN